MTHFNTREDLFQILLLRNIGIHVQFSTNTFCLLPESGMTLSCSGDGSIFNLKKMFCGCFEVTKTEFVRTPTIEIELNSQIYLASTSELIEKDWIMLELPQ